MPVAEPTVLDLHQYRIRHIGPKASVFPDTPGQQFTVLNRTDMVARPLPRVNIPRSPDFAQGSWTGRMFDAGEAQFVFPNKESSEGLPWRSRFDPTNKLQWLEVDIDGYLEIVVCVTKVTPDRSQILVEGFDGFQMTKMAYVRDWTCIQAPRDVIERGTQLWMDQTSDSFPAGALNARWTVANNGGATVVVGPSGGAVMTAPVGGSTLLSALAVPPSRTAAWRALADIQYAALSTDGDFTLTATAGLGGAGLRFFSGSAVFTNSGGTVTYGSVALSGAPSYALMLEYDGEWMSGYVNGQLVGQFRGSSANYSGGATFSFGLGSGANPTSAIVSSFRVVAAVDFLQRGSDKGDYVLPGSTSTYPSGGLHARYSNNLDLQSDAQRLLKIHAPLRMQAYAGSGSAEYQNQQDTQINAQANPTPGAATSGWSVIEFGSIYLKLSAGNYTFQINNPAAAGCAVRVWVGKTKFGDQLVDSWTFGAGASTFSFTVTAANLAGTLGYGGGTVQRDGWYPIKVEYAVDSTARSGPQLFITNSPAAYTDPGGTAIASGAQATVVPATSLSPLGMVDQRFQGTSHYDLVQKTALAFGYQFSLEPQKLESGLFPGVIAPRIREGTDYDVVIKPDDNARREAMLNYSALTDGSDQVSSIIGNGAGFQNGTTGQLQVEVYDAPTLQQALFDMQGWQDSADASFPALLKAILQGQLGLRLVPWSVVSGDPFGRERKAYTWPLPGTVANFRWRPGDGTRIFARDINVQDTSPRQMLEVVRNISPNGVISSQVHFASRPKGNVYANRQALSAALRPQRNYQRQLVTIPGAVTEVSLGPGATSAAAVGSASFVNLYPGDTIVRARLRVATNTAPVSFNVFINNVDQTTTLNGPWTTVPLNLDLSAVAGFDVGGMNFYVQIKNNSGVTTSAFIWQLLVDVLR